MNKGEMLVRAFEEAAMKWGWEMDQDDGRAATRALSRHKATKKKLLEYVQDLEAVSTVRGQGFTMKEFARELSPEQLAFYGLRRIDEPLRGTLPRNQGSLGEG